MKDKLGILKNKKRILLGFLVGFLVTVTFTATKALTASNVTYTPSNSNFGVSNVNDALAKLSTLNGTRRKTVIKVAEGINITRSGGTLDIRSAVSNYANITADNIYYSLNSITGTNDNSNITSEQTIAITKTYNASTGVLTYGRGSITATTVIFNVDVYVIY